MNKKLNHFTYSQNSINTYKSCPLKFKYKYIEKINWKHDDIESREYYESLKIGTEFHLLCERYFSNIPLGITVATQPKFIKWIEKVKVLIPMQQEYTYLPEYEVRYKLNGNMIQAKYDLIVIKENEIEIWDWKTENKKVDYKNAENRMQTIVYMLLAKEVIPKLLNVNIATENIKMKYYQPEFDTDCVTISYSDEKHAINKKNIISYIDKIQNTKYNDKQETYKYDLIKDKKHCQFCEFNKLCNGVDLDYSVFEEEIYGR